MTIPDVGLVSLRPNRVDGWLINENAGYYVHQGRVYLQGEISTVEGVTASIFIDIPSQVCPSTDRHFTLYADLPNNTDDALDPALVLPNTYAATMHTNGSFSLDAPPPPQVVSTPGGTYLYSGVSHPRYINPMTLTLALPNVSWALEDDADDYTPISFAPYMAGADFTDIDATIAKHGSRVHLDGHVTANIDHAVWLSLNLPTDYQPASGVDGPAAVINTQDPRIHRIGDVEHATIGFNNDQPTLPGGNPPGTFPYLDRGVALRPGVGVPNIFQVGDAVQRGEVSESYEATCECTVYNLACIPEGTDHESPGIGTLPPGGHSATGSVAALLANYDPQPDWIRVSVSVEYSGGAGFGGCYPCVSEGGYIGGGCIHHLGLASVQIDAPGPLIDSLGASVSNALSFDYDAGDVGDAVIGTLAGVVPVVYVARPSLAYTGAPGDLDDWQNILLWRPDEIDDIVFSWDGTQSDRSVARWFVFIEPFWERRTAYFREGDVLDLTGCGWHLLTVTPGGEIVRAGPGTIRAFPGPGGLRPRGQSKMVRP